jgi:hypothetical protein
LAGLRKTILFAFAMSSSYKERIEHIRLKKREQLEELRNYEKQLALQKAERRLARVNKDRTLKLLSREDITYTPQDAEPECISERIKQRQREKVLQTGCESVEKHVLDEEKKERKLEAKLLKKSTEKVKATYNIFPVCSKTTFYVVTSTQ